MRPSHTLLACASACATALLFFAAQPAAEEGCGEPPVAAATLSGPESSEEGLRLDLGPQIGTEEDMWGDLPNLVQDGRTDLAPDKLTGLSARASFATFTVRGVVLGTDGAPWSGLHVAPRLQPEGGATTDGAGRFEFLAPARSDVLICDSTGFTALGSPELVRGEILELVVVRSAPVDIEVVDKATGLALLGANVALLAEGKTRTKKTSDHQGFVRFGAVPEVGDYQLSVTRPGYLAATASLAVGRDGRCVVALEPRRRQPTVVGTVVDSEGEPIAGAAVALGKGRARTNASGEFELETAVQPGSVLSAHHPRCGTASQALDGAAGTGAAPSQARLVLAPPAAESAAVCVRDPAGQPLVDVRVVPLDAHGDADPLVAHWLTARTDSEGMAVLPPGIREFAAVNKSGAVVARLSAE